MIPMISFSFCHCFDNCLIENIQSQRLYEIHAKFTQQCYRQCFWFLQAQQEVEQTRRNPEQHQAEQARLVKKRQEVEQVRFYKAYLTRQEQWERDEQARMLKKQQQIDKKVEEARIAKKQEKIRLTIFACRRCSVKFPSNIKFHQHICDHHTRKSKSAVSSPPIFSFTFSHSAVFLFDTSNRASIFFTFSQSIFFSVDSSKSASQSKILFSTFSTSITSLLSTSKQIISSKILFFSNSASEFVSKHSKNTFICSLTSPFSSSQKFAVMRSTSLCNLSSKFYLTINDLFRMFVEKFKSIDLQQHQNHQFSQRIFDISKRDFMQMRIISYFLLVKSTIFETFTSVHDSIKQSTRTSFQRSFSFRFFFYSFSIRLLFSTSFVFFLICWRCQEPFVICLFRNWADRIAAKVEIFMKRRERRLFV